MKTTTKLTASEKRQKETFESLVRTMEKMTLDLRERFYVSYVDFYKKQQQERMDALNDKLRLTDGFDNGHIRKSINQLESRMNRTLVNQLNWTLEAKENFDAKIEKVCARLMSFGVNTNIKVTETWIETNQEVSFEIDAFDSFRDKLDGNVMLTAHARLIWVSCTDKASHWRFICTKRKAK